MKEWDVLLEARQLRSLAAEDSRAGFLVAVYRQFDAHVKMGLGYNFTRFSDNLTDLSFRATGGSSTHWAPSEAAPASIEAAGALPAKPGRLPRSEHSAPRPAWTRNPRALLQ